MKKILVTYDMPREGYADLISKYDTVFPPEGLKSFTYDQVFEIIHQFDGLLSMFNFRIDKKLMEQSAGKLKIISNYAVGYDNIDVNSATELGIQVTNTPDPVTEPTADQAMGLLLAVSRRISEIDRRLRIPGSMKWGLMENLGHSLYGKTIGIIGMGRIGQALARRALASGMEIVYNNRKRLPVELERKYNASYLPFDELIKTADVISLNAPHTAETTHLIGEAELNQMKPSAILINTARGPLVDEKALIKALQEKKIWGAGLDVFEFGDRVSPEFLTVDNVVVNPHTGTQTYEVRLEMAQYATRNIINFFEGNGPVAKVNQL